MILKVSQFLVLISQSPLSAEIVKTQLLIDKGQSLNSSRVAKLTVWVQGGLLTVLFLKLIYVFIIITAPHSTTVNED